MSNRRRPEMPTVAAVLRQLDGARIPGGCEYCNAYQTVQSPAMVIRTRATTVPAVIDRWGPEPRTVASAADPTVTHETAARPPGFVAELPDDDTVDLVVFGLGRTYREYAVRHGDGLGEWQWPPRV